MKRKRAGLYDIRDIWAIAWKRKWMIIIPLILVGSVTYGVSYYITPQYEANTIITIDQDVPLTSEIQRLLGTEDARYRRDDQRRERLKGYYNELTSTLYLTQLVQKLDLDEDPELDQSARKVLGIPNPDPNQLAALKFDLLQEQLKDQIDVSFAAANQMRISVQSKSPSLARDICNTLAEIFRNEKTTQDMTSIRSTQEFSDTQLQKYERQLQDKTKQKTQLEKRLLTFQLDEAITSESNRNQISAEIDRSNNDIDDYRNQERDVLKTLADKYNIATNNLTLDETDAYADQKKELRRLVRTMADQTTKYAWSDPQILNYKLRQNNVLKDMEEENGKAVDKQFAKQNQEARDKLLLLFNIRTNLDFLYSKVSYLTSANEELTSKMNMGPELQADLNRINEEIAALQDIRDRFKRQQESSTISQAYLQDASKYSVVEPAKLPLKPFLPDRKKIAMMGIALGLMIGVAAAVIMELLDNSLKKVEEVEEFLGLPVLGIAPKAEFMKKVG